jgi:hypothetical protein
MNAVTVTTRYPHQPQCLREPDRAASRRYGAIQSALRERHPTKNLHHVLEQPSVPIPEGRHSVVQRRFRLFIRSGAYGTMRPWHTLANHAYTIRRMEQCQEDAPTKTRATIRLTPVLSVLRRQLTASGRHLTCLVSVALRSTQRSNEATSNASNSARRRCFTLPTLPRF